MTYGVTLIVHGWVDNEDADLGYDVDCDGFYEYGNKYFIVDGRANFDVEADSIEEAREMADNYEIYEGEINDLLTRIEHITIKLPNGEYQIVD